MPAFKMLYNRLKKITINYKKFDEKYSLSQFSALISFYMFIASISLLGLTLGLFGKYLNNIDSYVLSKIFEIIKYLKYEQYFKIDTFSIIIFINIIWSSSKVINGYNKISDILYKDIKRRNGLLLRVSSFIMFSFLLVILLFELSMNLFLNRILKEYIDNMIIFRLIEFIIELIIIYVIIVLLYIYAPPFKTKYKDVKKGALFTTILLYLFITIVILLYNIISKNVLFFSINTSFTLIISIFLISIYICNMIIILGLIINRKNYIDLNKKINK